MLTGGLQGCCFQQLLPPMAAACHSTLYLRCSHCILRLLVSSTTKGSLPVSKTSKIATRRLSDTAQRHPDGARSPLTKCIFYISPVLPLWKKKRCYIMPIIMPKRRKPHCGTSIRRAQQQGTGCATKPAPKLTRS